MKDDSPGLLYRLMPAAMRVRLDRRPALRDALFNLNWLVAASMFDMLVGLVIGAWMARYLGPEQYGVFGYVLALYGLFTAFSNLGVYQVGMRELASGDASPAEVLGTSLAMRAVAAVLSMLAFLFGVWWLRDGDPGMLLYAALLGLAHVASTPETVLLWFQTRLESKYIVLARIWAKLAFSAVRLGLIGWGATVAAFVAATGGEFVLAAALIVVVYLRRTDVPPRSFRVNRDVARRLFEDGWPLTLSALMTNVYSRIDQVMLGDMLGDHEVGIYLGAVRLTEAGLALPGMVLASALPALIVARKQEGTAYHERLQVLYDGMFWVAVSGAVFTTLAAGPVIQLLFGDGYRASADVLRVHIWAAVFQFPGVVTHRYLMVESQTRVSMFMTGAGALTNFAANLVLIPRYGAVGAAWATLLSHAMGNLLGALFFARARQAVRFNLAALNPIAALGRLRALMGAGSGR